MNVQNYVLISEGNLNNGVKQGQSYYKCGKCNVGYTSHEQAEACCAPMVCTRCGCEHGAGNPFCVRSVVCPMCRAKQERRDHLDFLRTAEVVVFPKTDFIYHPDLPGSYINLSNYEGTGKSVKEIVEDVCTSKGDCPPCYVMDCDPESWRGLDMDSVLENELCDWYEDAEDFVEERDELKAFIASWNAKQTLTQYHNADRIIILDAERFAELVAQPVEA